MGILDRFMYYLCLYPGVKQTYNRFVIFLMQVHNYHFYLSVCISLSYLSVCMSLSPTCLSAYPSPTCLSASLSLSYLSVCPSQSITSSFLATYLCCPYFLPPDPTINQSGPSALNQWSWSGVLGLNKTLLGLGTRV